MDGSKSLNAPWTGRLRRTRYFEKYKSGKLRVFYFRTMEHNSLCFVRFIYQDIKIRLLSPNPIKKNVPGKMNKNGMLKLYIIFGAYAL